MTDPAILFIKPKAISASDKKALRAAGVVVVEIDNPADAKFIRATTEMSTSDLLRCAAKALGASDFATRAFGAEVAAMLASAKDEKGAP